MGSVKRPLVLSWEVARVLIRAGSMRGCTPVSSNVSRIAASVRDSFTSLRPLGRNISLVFRQRMSRTLDRLTSSVTVPQLMTNWSERWRVWLMASILDATKPERVSWMGRQMNLDCPYLRLYLSVARGSGV